MKFFDDDDKDTNYEKEFELIEKYIAEQMKRDPRERLKESLIEKTRWIVSNRPATPLEITQIKWKWFKQLGFEMDMLPPDPFYSDVEFYTELLELDKKNPNALAERRYHFVSRIKRPK